VVAARLKEAGLESPAHLGTMFLADHESLAARLEGVPPLVDDRPHRLNPRVLEPPASPVYFEMMEVGPARERFRASAVVARLWPAGVRDASLAAFPTQAVVNRIGWIQQSSLPGLPALEQALTGTALETVVLWYLGTSSEEQQIVSRLAAAAEGNPEVAELRGLGALARRDYRAAETLLGQAEPHAAHGARLRQWRILACGLAGDRDCAARLFAEAGPLINGPGTDKAEWAWLAQRFELTPSAAR
jgi:hypothetical protein